MIDIENCTIEVEEKAIHPHLLASLIVCLLMIIVGATGWIVYVNNYWSSGGRFAIFVGLFFLVFVQVVLLASRPMPYEIENYKRRRKKNESFKN